MGDPIIKQALAISPLDVKQQMDRARRALTAKHSSSAEPNDAELEKACDIGYLMHTTAMKMTRPGIYESEIAGVIEGIALSHGHGVSFPVILSKHGETLHNHFHGNLLDNGDLLLMDAGAETFMNYSSDFTRVVPVSGKFTQKQKQRRPRH